MRRCEVHKLAAPQDRPYEPGALRRGLNPPVTEAAANISTDM